MAIVISLLLLISGSPHLLAGAHGQPENSAPSTAERRIFDLLNQERIRAGEPLLEWNASAARAARAHAALLARHGEMSHQFYGEPVLLHRLEATAVRFSRAGENIACADDPEEAHLALMNSPGHRANIMNPEFTGVGIGVVEHQSRLYVTQDFIRIVPLYSEDEFLRLFTKTLNAERQKQGLAVLMPQRSSVLHEAACSTRGDAQALPVNPGFAGEIMVFSLSEPQKLPAQLLDRALVSRFRQMRIGACFRPDAEHGNANFWVVTAFGG
jgi:cysteine-rich secretory family protein